MVAIRFEIFPAGASIEWDEHGNPPLYNTEADPRSLEILVISEFKKQ